MAAMVRAILLNTDASCAAKLRSTLLAFEGLKIVAEVDEPVLLGQATKQFPADVVILHLDPDVKIVLHSAGQAIAEMPDLAFFAISESSDGQLILSAMRLGIREFLTKPIDQELLAAALEKVTQRRLETETTGRLITVLGSAGGVGATSIATNLAVELRALADGDVALVDLDFRFGQVATMLDLEATYTIADLCDTPEQLEPQMIERVLVQHRSGVRVLARPVAFAQAENITAAHCAGVLTGLTGLHEYVVVDGPSRFDVGAKAVLDLADDILLVMNLLVPCVRNVSRMIEGMREVGFNLERLKLICNRAGRDAGNLSLDDVRKILGLEIYAVLPDDWATVSNAINLGEPLVRFAERSRVRLALRELAERLYQPEDRADETERGRKGGLLSRIFADV
ncbi:MAG: AAA family ATPase [Planctomycetota bacterium]|jgi:pilus assembly protein CpaE